MAYKRIECPRCKESFGQEKRFLQHLEDQHDITDILRFYLDTHHGGVHPTCRCSERCSEKLTWGGWKDGFTSNYVRGHNAKLDSVYLDPQKQEEFRQKRIEGYRNGDYSVWNSGLTKETCPTLLQSAEKISASLTEGYAVGKYSPWQKGKTKDDCEALKKSSETHKERIRTGQIKIWNDGETKETHPSVTSAARKISASYGKREAGNRLTNEQLAERVNQFSSSFELLSSLDDYKTRRIERLSFRCKQCGAEQLKSLAMLEDSPVCFSCCPKESAAQLELFNFVKSLRSDAILSDRSIIAPKELDVWIPSAKLGIEYNGLYWHSSSNILDSKYHLKKSQAALSAGISLLSIYEDEWRDKRSIVEGMIRHRLTTPDLVLDARKLRIEELHYKDSAKFFNENHLEGYVKSTATFCLRDDYGIYAAMSLRKPFHKKYTGFLEVARCCTATGVSVRGWLGRLTSYAKKYALEHAASGLMTYVDDRVGVGKGYTAAGWIQVGNATTPRFWWTDFRNRFNRFQYKADPLRSMTQDEVAKEAGVVPIWGCGNRIFIIKDLK